MINDNIVTSILPPLKITPTFLSSKSNFLCIKAAIATAPAPSTTSFCFSSKNKIEFAISLSSTSTISSTSSSTKSSIFGCVSRTAIPSAIVLTDVESSGFFASKDSLIAGAPEAVTPIIFILGFFCFAADATPLISPPPPIGTTIKSKSGTISSISIAIVPCPAITKSSAKGWINVKFCLSAKSVAYK